MQITQSFSILCVLYSNTGKPAPAPYWLASPLFRMPTYIIKTFQFSPHIANLGLIPPSQIRKFLGVPVSKSQFSKTIVSADRKSQKRSGPHVANPQNICKKSTNLTDFVGPQICGFLRFCGTFLRTALCCYLQAAIIHMSGCEMLQFGSSNANEEHHGTLISYIDRQGLQKVFSSYLSYLQLCHSYNDRR